MANILIAEDDQDIIEILRLYLENNENRIFAANDGKQAIDIFRKQSIDIALIDIMMPKIDGYKLVKMIRETSNTPIIIISAKTMENDKILGLNIGADDYIEKPFKPLEVVARINAQLRRFNKLGANSEVLSNHILKIGELSLNTRNLTLNKNDELIDLTPVEYKILHLFMSNADRVYTKSQIYTILFGGYYESDDNTLMVHISNLRNKIEDNPKKPKYIKTIRGLGYKIERQ